MTLEDVLAQEEIEKEGAWLPLPTGGEMLIAYAGSEAFERKRSRLEFQYKKEHGIPENKEVPTGKREGIVRDAMVGTVCKAIRDVPLNDEEMLDNTPQNIRRLLDSRKVRTRVLAYSTDETTFEKENLELISGNFEPSSDTDSDEPRLVATS